MTLRLMASGSGAAVIAVIAVGCGGGADLSSVAKAAGKTQKTKTAKYSMVFAEAGKPDTVASGALDFSSRSGVIRVRDGGGVLFESIWIGSTVYIKGAEFGGAFDAKPWLKLPKSASAKQLDEFKLLDPTRIFGLLGQAGHFDDAGKDEVRGVSTTHYRGEVSLRKFIKAFLPAEAQHELIPKGGDRTFSVEAWVDENDLVRKVFYDLPSLGENNVGAQDTTELYDFGAPVHITPPPADQVRDVTG